MFIPNNFLQDITIFSYKMYARQTGRGGLFGKQFLKICDISVADIAHFLLVLGG